jgi:17beta-estradiol 17-dehydrogenase / very-long-chain 3-oxoacyl-CoA reductase
MMIEYVTNAFSPEMVLERVNDLQPWFLVVSVAVTGYLCLRVILSILNFIYVYFMRPGKKLTRYGDYAIVTGATDGIGKAYALELAARGMNLILVSRTQSKLDDVKKEISESVKNRVDIMTQAIDLTRVTDDVLASFEKSIADKDVGILVNNAGMALDYPDYLETTSPAFNRDLININVYAPTVLTSAVLPGMKSRKRGVIVNLGSANGILPAVPLLSTYAGSKAYINQFSRSMDEELKGYNIRVHDQCPFFVTTKISKIRKPRLDAPTPKAWARAAVKQIGYETDRTPYWSHGLMLMAIHSLCPEWAVNEYVHSLHKSFRRRFYRKQAQRAAADKKD